MYQSLKSKNVLLPSLINQDGSIFVREKIEAFMGIS